MNHFRDRSRFPFKLLVEGNDDLHVVAHLRDRYGVTDNFEIIDCKGVNNMADYLIGLVKRQRPTIETIGLIVDADLNLTARWESLTYVLKSVGYEMANGLDPEGTILYGIGRNPNVGIWVMPDNRQAPGMLEHFVATLIPVGDELRLIAERTIELIQTQQKHHYTIEHQPKALIHTWLAWQKDPGTPMGLAITKTYLHQESELCKLFLNWLRKLFTEAP